MFSNSSPQEFYVSLFKLWVVFIWWNSDTWLLVIFGHIRHLVIIPKFITIGIVHYLCCLSSVSYGFSLQSNKQILPIHEIFFYVFSNDLLGEIKNLSRIIQTVVGVYFHRSPRTSIICDEMLHFLQFLTISLPIICFVGLHCWLLAGPGFLQLKVVDLL